MLKVVETMDDAAGDETGIARADVYGSSIHGEGDHAFHAVDGFIVVLVRMGQGNLGSGGNGEFEHGEGTVGVGGFEEKIDCDLADADRVAFHVGRVSHWRVGSK